MNVTNCQTRRNNHGWIEHSWTLFRGVDPRGITTCRAPHWATRDPVPHISRLRQHPSTTRFPINGSLVRWHFQAGFDPAGTLSVHQGSIGIPNKFHRHVEPARYSFIKQLSQFPPETPNNCAGGLIGIASLFLGRAVGNIARNALKGDWFPRLRKIFCRASCFRRFRAG
jgi:hypothetical protein